MFLGKAEQAVAQLLGDTAQAVLGRWQCVVPDAVQAGWWQIQEGWPLTRWIRLDKLTACVACFGPLGTYA